MNYRKKLFNYRKIYDITGTELMFLKAVEESVVFHYNNCQEYAKLLKELGFTPHSIDSIDDLYKIPPIPTLYLKNHAMFSLPNKKFPFNATTSGTSGKKSYVGLDWNTALTALKMVLRTFHHYKLISPIPTNYIILGYQPHKSNKMGVAQTAFGVTLLAPALHRQYSLKYNGETYELDTAGVLSALERYSKMPFPIRIMGFPAYMMFLFSAMDDAGLNLRLPKGSKVFFGGGWKQFFIEKLDKNELFALVEKKLGVKSEDCKDFFGAVEHPVLYCDCKNHHFHVPIYSRVFIRNVKTLEPVPFGTAGLVNLVSPLMKSMPLVSVMTDDLAIMYDGRECGCGIDSPYFELLGRAGMENIKNCAVNAVELLKNVKL